MEGKNTNDTGEREERRGGKVEGEGEGKTEGREAEARQRGRYKGEIYVGQAEGEGKREKIKDT